MRGSRIALALVPVAVAAALIAVAAHDDDGDRDRPPPAAPTPTHDRGSLARAAAPATSATPDAEAAPRPQSRPSDADLALARTFEGRTLRAWLGDLQERDGDPLDPAQAAAAREMLLRGGAVGVDALFAALVADPRNGWNGPVRALVQDLRDALVPGLASLLTHEDPVVRGAAFRELRKIGEAGGFGANDMLVARAFLESENGIDFREAELLLTMPGAASVMVEHASTVLDLKGGGHDALERLGADGAAAIPALIARMEEDLGESWRWAGHSTERDVYTLVAVGRGRPEVIRFLHDLGQRREEGADDLWRIRALALAGDIDPLLAALADATDDARDQLFDVFRYLDPLPERALTALVTALARDLRIETAAHVAANRAFDDRRVLDALIAAASRPGEPGTAAIWAFVLPGGWSDSISLFERCLASPDASLRLAVASLPVASAASWVERPLRRAAESDADPRVRDAARATLASFGGTAPATGTSTDDMVARLLSGRDEDRASALADLDSGRAVLAPLAARAAAWLTMKRPSWAPWNGVRLIEALGPRLRPSIAAIDAALDTEGLQMRLRLSIAGAVGTIGGAEAVAILEKFVRIHGELPELGAAVARLPADDFDRMLAATRSRDADVRAAFLRGLRSHATGETRGAVLGRARELLNDQKPGVRIAAAGTLIRLDPNSSDALAVLLAPLRGVLEPEDQTLLDACWELSEADVAHVRAAAPEIVRVLRSPVSSVTWTLAAAAAGRLPDRADVVVPPLVAGVEGRYGLDADTGGPARVRSAAIRALEALGPAAAAALPALRRAAAELDPWLSAEARRAVAAIDAAAAEGGLRAAVSTGTGR